MYITVLIVLFVTRKQTMQNFQYKKHDEFNLHPTIVQLLYNNAMMEYNKTHKKNGFRQKPAVSISNEDQQMITANVVQHALRLRYDALEYNKIEAIDQCNIFMNQQTQQPVISVILYSNQDISNLQVNQMYDAWSGKMDIASAENIPDVANDHVQHTTEHNTTFTEQDLETHKHVAHSKATHSDSAARIHSEHAIDPSTSQMQHSGDEIQHSGTPNGASSHAKAHHAYRNKKPSRSDTHHTPPKSSK